jgi:hypothetical protein
MRKNNTWEDIVKIGFMGTDRMTPSVETLDALHAIGIKTDEISEAIIEGAGVISLLKKGGYPLKKHSGKIPSKCAEEEKKNCSTTSIKHLKEILKGRYEGVFEEFLYYLDMQGKVLPPDTLPRILHFCRGNMKLWAIVGNVIGERGKWLLAQNADWGHLAQVNDFEKPTPPQYKKEETLVKAKEIVDFLQTNRLVWFDDRKVQTELKDLAYKADLDLYDSLQNIFSNEMNFQWENKINDFFDILRFRKNMIFALKSP